MSEVDTVVGHGVAHFRKLIEDVDPPRKSARSGGAMPLRARAGPESVRRLWSSAAVRDWSRADAPN